MLQCPTQELLLQGIISLHWSGSFQKVQNMLKHTPSWKFNTNTLTSLRSTPNTLFPAPQRAKLLRYIFILCISFVLQRTCVSGWRGKGLKPRFHPEVTIRMVTCGSSAHRADGLTAGPDPRQQRVRPARGAARIWHLALDLPLSNLPELLTQ